MPTTESRIYRLEDLLPRAAKVVFDSYPGNEFVRLDPDYVLASRLDDLRDSISGDSLFHFLVSELNEGVDGRNAEEARKKIDRLFERVRTDINDFERALNKALDEQT